MSEILHPVHTLKPHTQVQIVEGAAVGQDMGICIWKSPEIVLEVDKHITPTRVKLTAPGYGQLNRGGAAYGNGAIYAQVDDLKVVSQPTEYEEKFIVINRKHLSALPLELQSKLIDILTEVSLVVPANKYYVCNQDEPYAAQVLQIILDGETTKWSTAETTIEWRSKVMRKLMNRLEDQLDIPFKKDAECVIKSPPISEKENKRKSSLVKVTVAFLLGIANYLPKNMTLSRGGVEWDVESITESLMDEFDIDVNDELEENTTRFAGTL